MTQVLKATKAHPLKLPTYSAFTYSYIEVRLPALTAVLSIAPPVHRCNRHSGQTQTFDPVPLQVYTENGIVHGTVPGKTSLVPGRFTIPNAKTYIGPFHKGDDVRAAPRYVLASRTGLSPHRQFSCPPTDIWICGGRSSSSCS